MSARTTRLLAARAGQEAPAEARPAALLEDERTPTDPVRSPAWTCRHCGAEIDAVCSPLEARCIDAGLVEQRLEQAGVTLLSLQAGSPWPMGFRTAWPSVLADPWDAYGWTGVACRPAIPDARAIDAMDATYAWLQLIPRQRFVLRRIVAARSLVHPVSLRHVLSWRQLGRTLGADHHAVRMWHERGIRMIVTAMTSAPTCQSVPL